jgi:hypothetical protein
MKLTRGSTNITETSFRSLGKVDEPNKTVRFEVLAAASMKMAVFWVVVPCSLVEVYQRFRVSPC